MRFTSALIPTLREVPKEAEVISHQLMFRSGMIRKLSAGIFNYLPLGLRVLRKVERIVREEMNRAGALEILMPAVLPSELWKETGRWDFYGDLMLRLTDRGGREYCIGPTHEEIVTDIIRKEVHSYRQLPLNLYQIQTKFRDEIRPRFGVLRAREFIMKDAYSFDVDRDKALESFDKMYKAYERICKRLGFPFRTVEADAGTIGGSRTFEFMVLAENGEDDLLSCAQCGYAANREKAETLPLGTSTGADDAASDLAEVHTPDVGTIEDVSGFLQRNPSEFIKALLYRTDSDEIVMGLVRGDAELNEFKLRTILGCEELTLADEETIQKTTGAGVGFAGPVNLSGEVRVFADHGIKGSTNMIAGANRTDYHLTGIHTERDFKAEWVDIRNANAGEQCPRCKDGKYAADKGIEVGHVFYLGTKYSEAMGAKYLDENGAEQPCEMGCYGIGVSRIMAAAIEVGNDKGGILWPMVIAPFHVYMVTINPKGDAEVAALADGIEKELEAAGVEVIHDDRDERPGVKFNDADLLGIPLRITVGTRAVKEGQIEFKRRDSEDIEKLDRDSLVGKIKDIVASERDSADPDLAL
jgi:prolyl-tRNA synthetase